MSTTPTRINRERPHPERWVAFAAMILISIGFLAPLLWMLSTSLKPLNETMLAPPELLPRSLQPATFDPPRFVSTGLANFHDVITHNKMDFPQYTRNTLWITVLSIIGTVTSSSLVAYGFAKVPFKGRSFLFGLMISTMMIPFPVLMVPLFAVFKYIGDYTPLQMLGTLRPLWLPTFFASAFNVFLLRQFYITIPDELSEAARIDGCSEFGIWWRVILPLSKPALAVVALFTFIGSWNNFQGPLIYLQHPDQYTLALGLQVFQSSHGGTEWSLLMAASLLILSPVIVIFFLAQKTFIQGIATTGMKG